MLAVIGVCATLAPPAAAAEAADEEVAALEAVADEDRNPLQAQPIGSPAEWIIHEDYPREALREQVSGATGVRLDVDERGVPTSCSVTATSGSALLDSTTCAKLMERARFHPVLDSGGLAVPGVFETKVRWSARDPEPDPKATTPQPVDISLWVSLSSLRFDPDTDGDRSAEYDLVVDETGTVTDCTITRSSGDVRFDQSLCRQLEVNAAFDVSSSGPGSYSGYLMVPEQALRSFPPIARSDPRARNVAISAFIEDDGSVSDCRWVGRNAPQLDPWPVCTRSSWVDQRDVDGKLVRGAVNLGVSQRQLDELAIPRDEPTHPANRDLTVVFSDDGSISDCRWSGANPPPLDPWLACNHAVNALKRHEGLEALMRGTQSVRLDENEVESLAAAQNRAAGVN